MNRNPLIVALDVQDKKQAISLVKDLKDYVKIFKVGPVLFTKYGPSIVKEIQDYGSDVFLDFKLYDIPNTVASTVKAIIDLNIFLFTVHISGGEEMLKAAVDVLKETRKQKPETRIPKVLGVTILTSVANVLKDNIIKMVDIAKSIGLDGVISSPLEVSAIRKATGKDFLIVTPGIRPSGADVGDQKRVATPKTAIENGADYIVVGRPIIEAQDPVIVAKDILSDISSL